MGVKIFRENNWHRITNGVISRGDILRLDREKDKELIAYLIRRAPPACAGSMLQYAGEKYGVTERPEPLKNTDDPDDPRWEEYFVLQEQAVREEDRAVLEKAAFHGSQYDMAAFAFCRLTGYGFPTDGCDAYSYRTFRCDTLPGMTEEDIRAFCRRMIEKEGPFKKQAEECLRIHGQGISGDPV